MQAVSDDRLQEIDLLRFLAALAVVFYHYTFLANTGHGLVVGAWPELAVYSRYGYLGVELFFMISGFVILLSAQGRSTGAFVRSRIIRLYPAYWLGVTLTAIVLAFWGEGRQTVTIGQYLANLTMLQKFVGIRHIDGVYWTLVVEMKFYLLVWLLLRTGAMTRLRLWLWLWLAGAAVAQIVPAPLSDRLGSLLLAESAPFFSVGIACFLLRRDQRRWQDWLLLVIAGVLASEVAARDAAELSAAHAVDIAPTTVRLLVALFCLIFAAIALDWSRVLRWSGFTPVGALTYPLYLLHAYIGYALMRQFGGDQPSPVFVLLLVAGMIAAAWLMHRFGERPLAAWLKQKLARMA